MNVGIKFSTYAALEVHEAFVINIHGRIYMGWKESDLIVRSINSLEVQGEFNSSNIEASHDVVVIGTTDNFIDVQRYAHWFVGDYPAAGNAGVNAAFETLQGVSTLRLAIQAADITQAIATRD